MNATLDTKTIPKSLIAPTLAKLVEDSVAEGWAPITKPVLRKQPPAKSKKTAPARKAGKQILALVEAASLTTHLAAAEANEDYAYGAHHLTDWLYEKCAREVAAIKDDLSEAVSLMAIIQADIVSVADVLEKLPEPLAAPVFKVIVAALRHAMEIALAVEDPPVVPVKARRLK
ncbi:hypothetical protein [Comamonas sp. B21-038]|uniref:hypothetical protein n=1 Tax=Comamonas sp. B21-038 TaxID=2918299 RepID=UPI001EFAA5CD|nr:hypothetical protein [Comamonas sp. B21-038]ULR87214.1 hypothetical protein MJ205_12055 [Comamonas sp. B21-038]